MTMAPQRTGDRFFNTSPTVRLRSSYTPPLINVITSTASKTLYTTPDISRHLARAFTCEQKQIHSHTFGVQDRHTGDTALD